MEYWQAFNDYAFQNAEFAKCFNKRKPSTDHWMSLSIGSSACHIDISRIQKRKMLEVEIYINEDKELFHSLYSNKAEIEATAGLKFDWRELPERKASRIIIERKADLDNENEWFQQFEWIMSVCMKMKNSFKKYI